MEFCQNYLVILFVRIIPTPTEKNTRNGKNLYGWFVKSVSPVTNGDINRVPTIRIWILFAYLLVFEIMNNPTITGSKNNTNTLSSLI